MPRIKNRAVTAIDQRDALTEMALRHTHRTNLHPTLIGQRAMTKSCEHFEDLCCCKSNDCKTRAAEKIGHPHVMFIAISPVLLQALKS